MELYFYLSSWPSFPLDLRLIVGRKVSDSNLDMDALLAAFAEETDGSRASELSVYETKQRKVASTASTLFSSSLHSLHSNADPQRAYCKQSHASASCSFVTDVPGRKQIFNTSGRCLNGPQRNHISCNCKSSSRCQKCKKKHHTFIHDEVLVHFWCPRLDLG